MKSFFQLFQPNKYSKIRRNQEIMIQNLHDEIINKSLTVINSCKNEYQMKTAIKYINLLINYHLNNVEKSFLSELFYEFQNKIEVFFNSLEFICYEKLCSLDPTRKDINLIY